jgi:hypothetical protein
MQRSRDRSANKAAGAGDKRYVTAGEAASVSARALNFIICCCHKLPAQLRRTSALTGLIAK